MLKTMLAGATILGAVSSSAYADADWTFAEPTPGWCVMYADTTPADADVPQGREIEVSFHIAGKNAEMFFRPHENSGVARVKPGTTAHLSLDGNPYLDVTVGDDDAATAPGRFGSLLGAMGKAQTMTITFGSPDDRVYELTLDASFRKAELQFLQCVQNTRN